MWLFAQNNGGEAAGSMIMLVIQLAIVIITIVSMWVVFTKAGKPGWAAIIPIYNIWVLLQIVGRPGWWIILLLIPFVNIVVSIIVMLDLAKSFGKSQLFGIVALWLFSLIGYLILGFGDAKYVGPAVAEGAPAPKETETKA